jgi:polar amino acid transport system permease protein
MNEILNQYFDLSQMSKHLDEVLDGFVITIELSLVAGALALMWGLALALLRQLPGRGFLPVRFLTIAYIDVFRGIPLLMIILLISGSLPFLSFLPESVRIPHWLGRPDPFWYGVMAITITYGAYMAEVYRAGIEAVPQGQMEAARSLGMSHRQAMRNVIVPQAVRKVIAPLLNDFIALMKDTTLVSVIALNEVALVGRDIQSQSFNSSALTLGAILFLLVTLPLARLVDRLIAREQARFTRGAPRVEAL